MSKVLVEFNEELFKVYNTWIGKTCLPSIGGDGHRRTLIDPTRIVHIHEGITLPNNTRWVGNTIWVVNDQGCTDVVYVSNSITEVEKIIEQYGDAKIVKCGK